MVICDNPPLGRIAKEFLFNKFVGSTKKTLPFTRRSFALKQQWSFYFLRACKLILNQLCMFQHLPGADRFQTSSKQEKGDVVGPSQHHSLF